MVKLALVQNAALPICQVKNPSIIQQDSCGVALIIVILIAAHGPDKSHQADQPQKERHRDKHY